MIIIFEAERPDVVNRLDPTRHLPKSAGSCSEDVSFRKSRRRDVGTRHSAIKVYSD